MGTLLTSRNLNRKAVGNQKTPFPGENGAYTQIPPMNMGSFLASVLLPERFAPDRACPFGTRAGRASPEIHPSAVPLHRGAPESVIPSAS